MHLAPLIKDLAVILGVAAIVTFIFRLIKQPVVLGYIIAGIIVGPYTPPIFSVVDNHSITIWAELGVIFLMFALGLEFSFRRLAKVGVSAGGTALLQIVTMICAGYVTGRLLDWSPINSVFLGCMISISSTTIIIKALDELGLKTRKFAELVFGILIVEDLAAIIMLVALTNIATQASVSGMDLLVAGANLSLVVGSWLVIGMFIVPRFVRSIGKRGNDEMLLVTALGLCLALVSLSAYFHYSVALGAFMMGSILAESKEAHRIEHLVNPLKDVFGAIFFVSVGMLLDPKIIGENFLSILAICLVIVLGKVLSVSLGSLGTGQSLSTSIQSGFSMAQIGEFSFIIATLGLSYKSIDAQLYPIIVAASLITTFTTPYLLKASIPTIQLLERKLPPTIMQTIERYGVWVQRRSPAVGPQFYVQLMRWAANAIVVLTIFIVSGERFLPWFEENISRNEYTRILVWALTFVASAPFIWAMLTAYNKGGVKRTAATPKGFHTGRGAGLVSQLATVIVVGLVSSQFFAFWISILVTTIIMGLLFFTFRRQVEDYYHWFEDNFIKGIETSKEGALSHAHLVPWDAHLAEIIVSHHSTMAGKSLLELQLREKYGVSVVAFMRESGNIVAPKPEDRIFPDDTLLCFGTDAELERLKVDIDMPRLDSQRHSDLSDYTLQPLEVKSASPLSQLSIRASGIREKFNCMVVGLERDGQRIRSPRSDEKLQSGDLLWIVGETSELKRLIRYFNGFVHN